MLAKFSVKRPFTVLVSVLLVIILGVVAFTRMTPNLLPDIDLPYVIVATTYIGASPEEVEQTITKPIEQSMATLDNIQTISSSSSENYSIVMMKFTDDANLDATTMNMREKLELLANNWDEYVGTPTILKINPNILPLAAIAMEYDGKSPVELSAFYDTVIRPRLEGVDGVASIRASGLITEQVNVVLQQNKMDAMNEKIRLGVDKAFEEGETALSDAQTEIDDGYEQLANGQKKISSGRYGLAQAKREAETQLTSARAQLDAQKSTLDTQRSDLTTARGALSALLDGVTEANDGIAALAGQIATMQASADAMADGDEKTTLLGQIAALDAQKTELENVTLPGLQARLSAFTAQTGFSSLAEIDAAVGVIDGYLAQVNDGYQQLDEEESKANGQIGYGYEQLRKGEQTLKETEEQLGDAQEQLDESKDQLGEAKGNAYDSADLNNLLTLESIGRILGAQNFSMPAGYAADTESSTKWLVYVGDKLSTVNELKDLVLFDLDLEGVEPIKLSDVADVFVSDNSGSTYSKINGTDGVLLIFNMQSGCATATVSDALSEAFRALEGEYDGLNFTALMDQGEYIHLVIDSVLENILLGAVLAVLILFLFLRDIRPTFVIACSIPISVTFAVVLMYFSGVSINIISLAGLAVGVGMLVDNSIVVIENIYRLRKAGATTIKAAVTGAVQMTGAITASTLTTVCVFLPIVFIEGLTRQIFSDMALTIAYSLLASLIIALTLVPALASGTLRRVKKTEDGAKASLLARVYHKTLSFMLRRRAIAIMLVLLLLVVSAYAVINKGFIYFPDMESPQMTVEITMPAETSFSEAVETTDEIARRVSELPEVKTCGAIFSGGLTSMFGFSAASENTSETMLYLVLHQPTSYLGYVPRANRQRSSVELASVIESLCADLDCEVSASGAGNMAEYVSVLGGSGVTLNLYGEDLDVLRQTASEIAKRVTAVDGVKNVSDGAEETTPALRITVDKQKAALEGLTVAQVYQNIALALTEDATATTIEDLSSDIVIRMQETTPTVTDVRDRVLTFQANDGTYKRVKLSDIATFTESETLQSISREGQRRYVTVSADLQDGYNVTLVTSAVSDALKDFDLPDGVSLAFEGENETIVSALKDLMLMLLLAVAIVYLIMVAQFQSLLSPLIVMATIPLAFTGGLIALLVADLEISIVAMIGFIMLVGIIVNNGIVLLDTMNQLRIGGMARREAILTASVTRVRPVLMTALTTILGLVPLSLGFGIGGGLVQPMAVVCIGGLVYATFMTLYIVPIFYDLIIKREPRRVDEKDLEVDKA